MADILHSIEIAAKPEAIYPLVATAKGFEQWWAKDVIEEAGKVELGFFNRTTLYRLKLNGNKSPARVNWICETGQEWAGTHIRFELEAGDRGTKLRFVHGKWQSESVYFVSCNTVWGELMFRLKAAAEGRSPGPLFTVDGMAA